MKKNRWTIGLLAALVMIGFLAYKYWGWEGVMQVFTPLCDLICGIIKDIGLLIFENFLTSPNFITELIIFITYPFNASLSLSFAAIYGFAEILSVSWSIIRLYV